MSTKSSGETQSAKMGISTSMHESRGGGQAMPRQGGKRRSILVSRTQHALVRPSADIMDLQSQAAVGGARKKQARWIR
jgi:hypothetical protein